MAVSFAQVLRFIPCIHVPAELLSFVFGILSFLIAPLLLLVVFVAFLFNGLGSALRKKANYKAVLITGASSGIGEYLAYEFATQIKGVRLFLVGRNRERMNEVKSRCESLGAKVELGFVDVRDRDALRAFVFQADDKQKLDCIIANAGAAVGTIGGDQKSTETCYNELLDINVKGVLNTVFPAIERFKSRRDGQIAVVGSLSGYVFFPGKIGAYSTTKSYVIALGESLRVDLAGYNVGVTTVNPGFVESNMTAQDRESMPFMVPTERACRIIVDGIRHNDAEVLFPFPMALLCNVARCLPLSLRSFAYSFAVGKMKSRKA
eukprot:ANDGO_06645.mRNA.1 putative oxidoreductase MXAN_5909